MQADAERSSANLIRGWEVVIGLEVHAQVTSRAKLFSGASAEFGGEPNGHVSLVDAAMPGMLPVINEVRRAGGAHRPGPQGQDQPGFGLRPQELLLSRPAAGLSDLAVQAAGRRRGLVEVDCRRQVVEVGIERLHLEQDAGKSMHDQHPECPTSISTAPAWR